MNKIYHTICLLLISIAALAQIDSKLNMKLNQQAKDYENLFKLFSKHQDKIVRVTLWGVSDGQSWLNNWPVRGRTNYPLLFDRSYKPKPAYNAIMALKK